MVGHEITDEQMRELFKEDIESGKYTVEQIRELIKRPWPTTCWHFEYTFSRGPRNYGKLPSLSKRKIRI